MKKLFLIALVLWLSVEVANQIYLSQAYRKGQFNWSLYAYSRNKQRIDQLYTLSNRLLKQRLSVEVRDGIIKDSTGFMTSRIRELVLTLASDIEPTGHFYYQFTPIQNRLDSVAITVKCPTRLPNPYVSICNCLDWVQPTEYEGAVLQLSTDQNSRLGPFNRLEYARSSNNSFLRALRASPCFFTTGDGGYLKIEENEPLFFPLKYNSKHWALLIWKLF